MEAQEQIVNVLVSAFVISLSPLSGLLWAISLCWFCLSHLKQLKLKEPDDCAHVNNPPYL